MTPPENVQATFCATLVDEWARAGVRHAVVSPGSRSTPLALALAADGRIDLGVHHDERAAAFMALGIGLATGTPAVVLTTSGTATAHLFPAVLEASHAGVPMLVCTADRPPELQGVGAPQTIDQAELYGRAVRWFADAGVADAGSTSSWRPLAARAVAEAIGADPGPVHLNLPFREPLVGEPGELPPSTGSGRDEGSSATRIATRLPEAARGVIVAGGGIVDRGAVEALARTTGWPVLADPRSGCRLPDGWSIACFDALLRHDRFAEQHRPDVVVRLGDAPASKVLASWLASSGAHQIAVGRRVVDPERTAAERVTADPSLWCSVATTSHDADPEWLASWRAADRAAQAAIEAAVDAYDELTEPFVARTVAAQAETLVVASSMPVRDVEWYAEPRAGLTVFANRGVNGIDGVVSTAVGVALTGRRVTALVGDVAFLHDSNALIGLTGRGVDLTIVVVDNRGGGIFSFLPQARLLPAPRFEELFGTPHDVDLVALAGAHGIDAITIAAPAELAGALRGGGVSVVVVPTVRHRNVEVHDELHAAVAAAVGQVMGG